MNLELSVHVDRSPLDVFMFLMNKDKVQQAEHSPVLVLEKTTTGPVETGTRYREVVQMLPFFRGEIKSVITRYEQGKWLEEDFEGAGMRGHLAYEFVPEGEGTKLIQRESLFVNGMLKPLAPIIKRTLFPKLISRLNGIKALLEKQKE